MDEETKQEKNIPIEIVKEILERLPLKSLARFKCVSKLCSSLIKQIISQRLHEEMVWRLNKFLEIVPMGHLKDEVDALREDPDGLRLFRDRLHGKSDEMQSLADFGDDFDQYFESIDGQRDHTHLARDLVLKVVRGTVISELLENVDSLITLALHEEEEDEEGDDDDDEEEEEDDEEEEDA